MSNAWLDEANNQDDIQESEKKFEDNFVGGAVKKSSEFQKLDDSEEYLSKLESRLIKLKSKSSVLKQLQDKKEECFNNLLNSASQSAITSDSDIQLETEVKSNDIVRHILPQQPHTIGEIAHLVHHDLLDIQKQENDDETEEIIAEASADQNEDK